MNTIFRLVLFPLGAISSYGKYRQAKKMEESGRFKDACYQYAVALLNGGVVDEGRVRARIRTLWETHGPFDYEKDVEQEIAEDGNPDCVLAGHAAVMSIIKEAVSSVT
jgi:hypothetical protein